MRLAIVRKVKERSVMAVGISSSQGINGLVRSRPSVHPNVKVKARNERCRFGRGKVGAIGTWQVEGVLKNGSVRLIIMMVLRKNCVDFDAMSVKENEDKTVAKPPAQIPRLADAQRSMMRLPAVPRGGFQFPESGGFQKSQAEKLLMIRAWGWHY